MTWGPYFASHRIVAMNIATARPFHDVPADRSAAVLAAVAAMVKENGRHASPLFGRLDVNAIGVVGYSLGGGGVLIAASQAVVPIRCAVALAPHRGPDWSPKPVVPEQVAIPVLVITAQW